MKKGPLGAVFDNDHPYLPISGKHLTLTLSKKHQKFYKSIIQLLSTKLPSLTVGCKAVVAKGFNQDVFVPISCSKSKYQILCTPSIWCGSALTTKQLLDDTTPMMVETVVTGSCLFGDHLIGKTNEGSEVVLTDMDIELPEGVFVESIVVKSKYHAYELMTHTQLDLLWPMVKSVAKSDVTLQFHLPVPEYILNGIQLYKEGKMCLPALQQYITAIVHKGYSHQMLLNAFKTMKKCKVVSSSPLDELNLTALHNLPLQELQEIVDAISVDTVVAHLTNEELWQSINASAPAKTLSDIAYQSYVVHVAKNASNHLKTVVVDNFNEKTICRKYVKHYPTLPAVLGMHYLPAMAPDNAKHCWFLAGEHEAKLSSMVRSGIYGKYNLVPSMRRHTLTP